MELTTMTKSEYAAHRGVDKSMVSKLVKEDRILILPDGTVDVEVSDLLQDKFSESPLRSEMTKQDSDSGTAARLALLDHLSSTDVTSYAEARARLTSCKADLAKIDLDRASGAVLDAMAVRAAAFSAARAVRDSILNIPDRIAPILAAETDLHTVRTLLDTELRRALDELSETIQ